MSWLFTEALIFPIMLSFLSHPSFDKDADGMNRRFSFFDGLHSFKKICEVHFNPVSPRQVIAPGKLHKVKCYGSYIVWKVEIAVKGLKSNQFPRVWFAVRGSVVVFLCLATHIDNYNDNKMDKIADSLVSQFFN